MGALIAFLIICIIVGILVLRLQRRR